MMGYEELEEASRVEGNIEYAEYRQTEEIQLQGDADSFNIKNGELFVERYWRVWLKVDEEGKISFDDVGERFRGEDSGHAWEDQKEQIVGL